MQNSNSTIKTIAKAVKVLKAISAGSNRLSDIAREVGISKNGTFRLLHSLMKEGMVVQDPTTRGYYTGPALYDITGSPLKANEHLLNVTHLEMDELRQATGETISLDIKFGMEKILLRRLIGTHNVTFIGKSNPISDVWLGASGKSLLSQLSETELDYILKYVTLHKETPYSITDKELYKQEIVKAKERGYATSISETDIGVAGVAVPIKGYITPAVLTITGPQERVITRIEEYAGMLKTKATKISRQLIG